MPQELLYSSTIRGEVIIGNKDPRTLTEEEFNHMPDVLYHGTAVHFVYSPDGTFTPPEADGSADYGEGFYTTDDFLQAQNYSLVRSRGTLANPIVYTFMPYKSRMLDVRDSSNFQENGILPGEFVNDWVDFLYAYRQNLCDYINFPSEVFFARVHSYLFDRVEALWTGLRNNSPLSIRDCYERRGIFSTNGNGLIASPFRMYMRQLGYDGMIYREGGEGVNGRNLTGYIFYNYHSIDTYEGWRKRKEIDLVS